MNFWRLLFSFVPVYRWRILFYILLNILCSVVSIISFSAVVPLLYVLFGLSSPNIKMVPWSDVSSFSSFLDVLKNNILFFLQEQILDKGTFNALLIICSFIVITAFISNSISYFAYFVRVPIRTGISRDLRSRIYDKLTSLYQSSYRGENKGDFVGRMTTDIEEVDYGISTAMDMLIENPVQIIIYLVALYGISVPLAADATILLLIASIIIIMIGYYMKKISLRGQSLKGKLISMYEETIEKNTIVHVFNLQDLFYKRFKSCNEELRNTHNRMNRVHFIAAPLSDLISIIILSIILFIGGIKIANGNSNIGAAELIYFLIIYHSIIRPMRSVIKATFGIRKAMASLERMEHILKIHTVEENDKQSPVSLKKGESITFSNVTFGYCNNHKVLDNINFHIPIGSVCTIVGNIGKGKTSIIKLLMKLEKDYSGNILLGQLNIKDISSKEISKLFSYVPQESLLFNDTILNNILLGNPNASFDDVKCITSQIGLHDYVVSLEHGYNSLIGEQGMNLSGGQKQLIAIARALLKNAPIIVLDEATSGIDIQAESHIINVIKEITRGKTLIIITHSDNVLKGIPTKIELQ